MRTIIYSGCLILLFACTGKNVKTVSDTPSGDSTSCHSNLPARLPARAAADRSDIKTRNADHEGMIWLDGGTFRMGATDGEGRKDEYPAHEVRLEGFWIDET